MSDLISRKTALERAETSKFTDENEKRKFVDWLNYCLEQPTVEAEPQWIPCSERLPGNYNNILVCQRDGYVNVGYYSLNSIKDVNSYPYKDVIAWQPLPQPYKAEQELAKMKEV